GKELEDIADSANEVSGGDEVSESADEGEFTENLDADAALDLPDDISDNGETALDEANEENADAESAQSNEEIPDLEGDVDLGGELSETDAAIESAESAPSEDLADSANEVSEVAQTEGEELELSADEAENTDNELDVELDFTALDELGKNEDSQQAQESDEVSADENTDKAKNEGEDIPKDLGDIADEEVGEVAQTEGKELEDIADSANEVSGGDEVSESAD
ncbi:MAG: hypothetical protein J1E28_07740, partial [Helicobacter sp.]|uniref:hypothetical protein n=1 Tax=Helicobacter sp. TaxID=218 RepID=UPI0025B825D8